MNINIDMNKMNADIKSLEKAKKEFDKHAKEGDLNGLIERQDTKALESWVTSLMTGHK